jgi:hypothetical protein
MVTGPADQLTNVRVSLRQDLLTGSVRDAAVGATTVDSDAGPLARLAPLSCASPAAARIARDGPPILIAIAAGFLWWESEGHGLDLLALVGCRGTVLEG